MSDSFGLSVDQKKYDYYYGGRAEWVTRVHSIPLDQITPSRSKNGNKSFLAKAGSDPLALRKVRQQRFVRFGCRITNFSFDGVFG